MTKLNQLANISVPDAKTLVVEPWDKTILKDVEKAIASSDTGLHPINDGKFLRISMPQVTEENRKELLKILGHKTEQARISVRKIRDSLKEAIVSAHKDGEISEDDKYTQLKKLDEFVGGYNEQIKTLAKDKEDEIMKI